LLDLVRKQAEIRRGRHRSYRTSAVAPDPTINFVLK
jgi:hypothetical protein